MDKDKSKYYSGGIKKHEQKISSLIININKHKEFKDSKQKTRETNIIKIIIV